MIKKDKELLSKDLCGRLLYGVNIEIGVTLYKSEITNHRLERIDFNERTINGFYIDSTSIKPFLRPMSSMTEEEKEYLRLNYFFEDWYSWNDLTHLHWHQVDVEEIHLLLDWFNAHHLDYRNLIKKGLALEAPKGMYNIKF